MEKIASTAPAAPSRWPVADLVDDIARPLRGVAEHALHRLQLQIVAQRRRGAVRVDVLDVGRGDAAVLHRRLHRAERAVMALGRRGDVVGVAGHAVAGHLGVDLRAAPPGVLTLPAPRTPAPSPITKPSRSLSHGRDASGGRSLNPVDSAREAQNPAMPSSHTARLGAAGDHHVGVAPHDQPRRIADRVHAGGAGRHHGMVRALEAVFDRQMAGAEIDQRRGDEERRQPPRLALVTSTDAFIDRLQAADAGADHHAGGVSGRPRFRAPSRNPPPPRCRRPWRDG